MLANLSKEKLQLEVEKILAALVKSGLIKVSPDKIKEIAATVTKKLAEDEKVVLSGSDLEDDLTKKAIGLACIAELNPNHKLEYSKLFSKNLEIDPKLELQLKLTSIYDKLLDKSKKLTPDQRKKLNLELEKLAALLDHKLSNENKAELALDLTALDLLVTQRDVLDIQRAQQRIMDYGVDTHNPGAVSTVVLAVIGNLMAFQDLANAPGENFMSKMNAPDLGVPDPLGIKVAAVMLALADGVVNTDSEIRMEQLLSNQHIPMIHTPGDTPTYTREK